MDQFWASPIGWTILSVLGILAVILFVLLGVAFLVYGDRKIWASVQLRKGPNVVGPWGLMQSFADLLKFILKEVIIPAGADKPVFLLAPVVSVVLALVAWAVIPFAPGWVVANINVGVLYLFAISSLGVYGIIMGGWASNSKYPFLGALRSAAQMVSYEVSIGFVVVTVILLAGSMNLSTIVTQQSGWFWHWNFLGGGQPLLVVVMLPMMVVFYVSALAETNRPPFDLPEAESELVAGYQVEYSSSPYMLFFLAEMANIILMCAMITILFFGGWNIGFPIEQWVPVGSIPYEIISALVFVLKILFWFFMIAIAKAIVPRYRYDQLMRLGWKVFLPISLVSVVAVAAWRVYGGAL
ncbi:MAG: NADH-quinone oxidoreductase subunit NuoH [Asticcacaulis sp.]